MILAAIFSSSTQVAETIKTMDLSMPTYDKISDAKNTAESLSTLVEPSKNDGVGVAASKKKSGPSISSVLPSMGKKGKKAPKVKVVEDAPEVDKKMEKIKIVDMNMPTYSETTATKEKSAFSI